MRMQDVGSLTAYKQALTLVRATYQNDFVKLTQLGSILVPRPSCAPGKRALVAKEVLS